MEKKEKGKRAPLRIKGVKMGKKKNSIVKKTSTKASTSDGTIDENIFEGFKNKKFLKFKISFQGSKTKLHLLKKIIPELKWTKLKET